VYFLEAPKLENTDAERLKSISSEEKYEKSISYMRSKGGTTIGIFWWSSIELARQCEGFICHFRF